jgi:flagellar hook-basal body complex protein FliE
MWNSANYYFDPKTGMPTPLKPGQKVPVGAKVASAFSDNSEDDNYLTQFTKSFYNSALDILKAPFNIAEVVQGIATGKDSGLTTDVMNAIDKWKVDTKHAEEIISLDAFMAGKDFWQRENFGDAGAWANFSGQVFGSLAQFITGGYVSGAIKAGAKASTKVAASQALAKEAGTLTMANKTADWFIKNKAMLGVSTAISLQEPLDAAERAGITGRDKFLLAATIAPVMGVIEIALGIDGKILDAIQKTGAKRLMAEAAAKVAKNAGGELTDEVLKKAFAETLKTATRTIPGVLKTMAINTGQEMTEEVLQTIWTKLVEKQYDHIKGYEGEGGDGGFGTEMMSPEAYKEYFMSAVGGAIGGFGGSAVLGGLKDSTKSHTIYEAATNPKEKLKLIQGLKQLVKDGKMSQEELDMANFRLESYERYNRDIAKTGMPQENKRKAFDLIWQAENAKEEIKQLGEERISILDRCDVQFDF